MQKRDNSLKLAFAEMNKPNPDLKLAFELLKKSAEKNNYEALYAIGTWYLHGRYVKKNYSLAVNYFSKAIKGNNCNAYYDMALCYEKGVGVKKIIVKLLNVI